MMAKSPLAAVMTAQQANATQFPQDLFLPDAGLIPQFHICDQNEARISHMDAKLAKSCSDNSGCFGKKADTSKILTPAMPAELLFFYEN